MGDGPLLAADAGQGLDGSIDDNVIDVPEGAASTTEGGSPSALSAMPEETDSDFSGHVQQVMPAAWRAVEGAEDLAKEFEKLESTDSQQMIFAAVESAAFCPGHRPREWPQHLEAQHRRQSIHAQRHYYLRGASMDDYATGGAKEEDMWSLTQARAKHF